MIALRDQIDLSPRTARRLERVDSVDALSSPRSQGLRHKKPITDELQTSLVSERRELHAALKLVYEAYLETQLIQPNAYEMRATRYHLLPTTDVFVATRSDSLLGTLTLVRDGEYGLPMEDVYADEVNSRRDAGVVVAEVSCLADNGHGKTNMLSVVVQLMSHMAQFARRQGVDELLIAVHPHHVGFYERFIGFEVIGGQKTYSAVCDKPAIALALDLNAMPVRHPRAYQRFFGQPFAEEELVSLGLDEATLAELSWIVNLTQPVTGHARQLLSTLPVAA